MGFEIKLDDNILKQWRKELEDKLKSGTVKIKKDGRTINDYLVYIDGKLFLPLTYMGYEVKDVTEDEENIIIKVGKKAYNWKPHSYNFNFKNINKE